MPTQPARPRAESSLAAGTTQKTPCSGVSQRGPQATDDDCIDAVALADVAAVNTLLSLYYNTCVGRRLPRCSL